MAAAAAAAEAAAAAILSSWAAASAAAYALFPIVSDCKELIWKNVFHHFPIPINEEEFTNSQIKEWSYQIIEKIKKELPSVPLESIPDPEDDKILCILTKKYQPISKSRWLEIDILGKIISNLKESNDNEIFFLLYRLLEK